MSHRFLITVLLALSITGCERDNPSPAQERETVAPIQNPVLNRQTQKNEAAGLRFDSNLQSLKPLSERERNTSDD